jgi:hypothetical protein
MAGPLAGISAAQIAQQKLPDQAAQQAQKQSPSKFDQALKSKGPDQAHQANQVGQVQHAQKVDQLRQAEQVNKSEKARLDKIQTQQASASDQRGTKTDPVTQKTEVSKANNAITGLFSGIERGQVQMDKLISGALGGKNFSNQELLAMQAGMYKYSQELELTSKVVEKATSGIKQTMNTQV